MIGTEFAFLYFAYGSNMSSERLRRRAPSARSLGRGLLGGHRLHWHKVSRDGSGKADAFPTAQPGDRVHGVLYRIDPAEVAALDEAESVGVGYDRHAVDVTAASGRRVRAWTYAARIIRPGLRPYAWYKRYVVLGAREHGLAAAYRSCLESTPCVPDPDADRAGLHWAVQSP